MRSWFYTCVHLRPCQIIQVFGNFRLRLSIVVVVGFVCWLSEGVCGCFEKQHRVAQLCNRCTTHVMFYLLFCLAGVHQYKSILSKLFFQTEGHALIYVFCTFTWKCWVLMRKLVLRNQMFDSLFDFFFALLERIHTFQKPRAWCQTHSVSVEVRCGVVSFNLKSAGEVTDSELVWVEKKRNESKVQISHNLDSLWQEASSAACWWDVSSRPAAARGCLRCGKPLLQPFRSVSPSEGSQAPAPLRMLKEKWLVFWTPTNWIFSTLRSVWWRRSCFFFFLKCTDWWLSARKCIIQWQMAEQEEKFLSQAEDDWIQCGTEVKWRIPASGTLHLRWTGCKQILIQQTFNQHCDQKGDESLTQGGSGGMASQREMFMTAVSPAAGSPVWCLWFPPRRSSGPAPL